MKLGLVFGCGFLLGQEQRLIKTSATLPGEWMTEEQVFELLRAKKNFFDVTDSPGATTAKVQLVGLSPIPNVLSQKDQVVNAQKMIDRAAMETFLQQFSGFHNRYYSSPTGVQAAEFLLEEVKRAGAPLGDDFSVSFFNHSWAQPSVIARIPGLDQEKVIVGAHLDSINMYNPRAGRAPGADDDGSGTTSNLEALRSLAKAGFRPKRTVEFHFYAAEEVGLRGSQAVAQAYANAKAKVAGMLQLDMTGYLENNKTKILTDYTDESLSDLVRKCIDSYSGISWFNGECGYACSDHASFDQAGFRSAQAGEDILNPSMHTKDDTMQHVNFDHVVEFTKLAVGFIIELAEPRSL